MYSSVATPSSAARLPPGYLVNTFGDETAMYFFVHCLGFDPRTFASYQLPASDLVCVSGRCPGSPAPGVLDYALMPGSGPVVPQTLWTPQSRVSSAPLEHPVWFFGTNGGLGVSLVNAAAGHCQGLAHTQERVNFGGRYSTKIRINWPGYQEWSRQIRTRDETAGENPITLERFVRHVGRSVDAFLQECVLQPEHYEPRWGIGSEEGICREHIFVIGAVHVSPGSWMPIIQLSHF